MMQQVNMMDQVGQMQMIDLLLIIRTQVLEHKLPHYFLVALLLHLHYLMQQFLTMELTGL